MAMHDSSTGGRPAARVDGRLQVMLDRLKADGHRLTPQRVAILRVLAESRGHPSVEQVHQHVLQQYPNTSLATVYKTVTMLKQVGEVLELGFSGQDNRYDGARPEPHPHLICTRCGAIFDPASQTPQDEALQRLAEGIAAETGFALSAFRLDIYGLCPDCQRRG